MGRGPLVDEKRLDNYQLLSIRIVKILADFVLVYGFLPEACGFLSGSHDPS
jgi:hypothetical protein